MVRIHVYGSLACFTRPEMKVERMSYPVITPSAARGIFEAILYKPEFYWHIRRIHVLKPIRFISLRRNEVKEKASAIRTIHGWMKGQSVRPVVVDATPEEAGDDKHGRTQRSTVALKDIAYVLDAEIHVRPGVGVPEAKYLDCFRRRVERGQCFAQPVFGCREFPAYFGPAPENFTPITETRDLGLMVYDVFDLDAPPNAYAPAFITLFHPVMRKGVITLDDWPAVRARHFTGGGHA